MMDLVMNFKKYYMLTLTTIILMFFSMNFLWADDIAMLGENASINGYVKDSKSEETLVGATVYLTNTKNGAFSNKLGYFSINNILEGAYTLKISMVGYETFEEKITLKKRQNLRKDIMLKPLAVLTDEVSVIADREVEGRQISISKVNIPVAQIKEIRIGGESDVFRTIQYLPGVLTSSQLSSGLYIRGGSPDQNLVLLDGATVYNPSHLFGFISTFNSDAIKDVELIKGGYPAEYGSRLSSVLNITQKDGNRNKFEGIASLGIISSKASLEGPIGNGSWCLSGRRTYFDLIKGAIDTDPKNPIPDFGFYDLNAKIVQDFGNNDKVFLSGFISKDNFDYEGSGFNINMFMGNQSGSLKWTHIFGEDLFSTVQLTGSNYNNGMKEDMSGYVININNEISDYTIKSNLEWFLSDISTVTSGLEITNFIFKYDQNFSGDSQGAETGTNEGGKMNLVYQDWVYSAFSQINNKITDLVSLQLGLRVSYWDYSKYTNFDPRISIRWQIADEMAIKASWGMFHQYLRLAGDENFSLFDTWLPTDKTVDPSKAIHYILSFETKPIDDIDFNFDVYYKDLQNISEVKKTNLGGKDVKDVFFSGSGYAYGAELFLQKKIGKFAGWIGYGLGWVSAKFDSINDGAEFRPKYDRRHDLKIVCQYQFSETWNFGATFMFQSGQSYTGATSRIQTGMPGDGYGYGKIIPSQRYGLRLPPSHQLNVNVGYTTSVWDLPFKINLDIFNVYSRKDILMRRYKVDTKETSVEDITLLPIIPTISFEIKF
jgi:hypothetical protein